MQHDLIHVDQVLPKALEIDLAGEPIPVAKRDGSRIIGGTVNQTGAFDFRATAVGADTALARIVQMVQNAQVSKAPAQGLADQAGNTWCWWRWPRVSSPSCSGRYWAPTVRSSPSPPPSRGVGYITPTRRREALQRIHIRHARRRFLM
jgi:E1-E2 ATPase